MEATVIELSDADIEASREPLQATLDFLQSVEATCVRNLAALPTIGGNIVIAINGVGVWSLVVRGERLGFFAEPPSEDVDFALLCEEWVLHELLDPDCEVDVPAYKKSGFLRADGDFNVFHRLLVLAQGGGGMLSTRARKD